MWPLASDRFAACQSLSAVDGASDGNPWRRHVALDDSMFCAQSVTGISTRSTQGLSWRYQNYTHASHPSTSNYTSYEISSSSLSSCYIIISRLLRTQQALRVPKHLSWSRGIQEWRAKVICQNINEIMINKKIF